jgi:hypothetical protein
VPHGGEARLSAQVHPYEKWQMNLSDFMLLTSKSRMLIE